MYLSTEGAGVFGVLGDFHLLDHLTEGSTITGSIFTGDSDLLRAFGLKYGNVKIISLMYPTHFSYKYQQIREKYPLEL